MAYATLDDVQARYHLPIEDDLYPLVEARIEDAEQKIRARIPALDDLVVQGRVSEAVLKRVISDAVLRILRNPEGYVAESDGSYSYQFAYTGGGSELSIPPEDWRDLGVRRGFGVVHPGPVLPWEAEL